MLTFFIWFTGYKEKSLLELYENSCSRLGKTPMAQIQRVFKEKAADTTHLSLSGVGTVVKMMSDYQ
jgi:hypothetical protein